MPFLRRCNSAVGYIAEFGYIPPDEEVPSLPPPGVASETPDRGFSSNDLPENVAKAVKKFQKFAGLRATAALDKETLELMGKPRCGVVGVSSRGNDSYDEPHGNLSNHKASWDYVSYDEANENLSNYKASWDYVSYDEPNENLATSKQVGIM